MKHYFDAIKRLHCLLAGIASFCSFTGISFIANAAGNPPVKVSGTSSPYAITERGPDYRVWRSVVAHTNEAGMVTYRTNSFREMATGMHQWQNGQWIEANDTIQITPDGSAAYGTNTQHGVRFANNLHVAGAIEVATPTGQHLHSTVLGLCYQDTATSNSVILANCADSIGQVLPSLNQVLYTNALTSPNSSFYADVRYTHKRNHFEQDIILRQQPPQPADFGLNPNTTVLQVWTEFFDTPEPKVSTRSRVVKTSNGHKHALTDQKLNFGSMAMGGGNAFVNGGGTNATSTSGSEMVLVPVSKRWVHYQGRTFLIEEVPLDAIASQVNALPPSNPLNGGTARATAAAKSFFQPLPSTDRLAKAKEQPMQLAKVEPAQKPGYLLDYDLIISTETNFTFQSDTTYYISASCNFYGTTTVEGGTVIKIGGAYTGIGVMNEDVNWLTSAYRPAIFTCTNDNSVGEALPNSSGVPGLAMGTGCYVANGGIVHDARFSYCYNGYSGGAADVEVSDCQFINCSHPITVNSTTTNLGLHNILITMNDGINQGQSWGADFAITVYPFGLSVQGEHVTADLQSHDFLNTWYGSLSSLNLTNSIILATNLVDDSWRDDGSETISTNAVYYAQVNPGTLFQAVGAGNYYLTINSPVGGIGTSNLNAAVLADIQQKTTWPPIILSNTFTAPTIFGPAVMRDTQANPDLGYHYPPIDYLSSYCMVSNTTLLLTNGVVWSYYNYAGLLLTNSASLISQGSPTAPDVIAYYRLVQEQATNLNAGFSNQNAIYESLPFNSLDGNLTNASSIWLRFTTLSLPIGGAYVLLSDDGYREIGSFYLRDCEIYACGEYVEMDYSSQSNSVFMQNNLFHRPLWVWLDTMGPVIAYNNLFVGAGGACWYYNGTGASPNITKNNAFDGSDVYLDGLYTNNAYLNGATIEVAAEPNAIKTNLTWVAGPLGFFYQSTNSPLINMGSITADQLGLYHYTTQVSQIKETNSTVDIGYHYVAVDTNGNPDSTLWLGMPDYLVDTNGDGDQALVSWQLEYFGHTGLDPNADPGGAGTNLLQDFQSGQDLTQVMFLLSISNNYVSEATTVVGIKVLQGLPGDMAFLVDNTNLNAAVWQPFNSNIVINLGSTEGWHEVLIGLRSYPNGSPQVWQWQHIHFASMPKITIATPTTNTVSQPIIQIYGFCQEPLVSISYDISNAGGTLTNLPSEITDQYYDTNAWGITTNSFECLDVPLTNGLNVITVHATDVAGQSISTNFSFVLDYSSKTNPPSVQITWPQSGTQISGSSFTLQGAIDDPTATVKTLLISTNSNTNLFWNGIFTNIYVASVERNGKFWLENLPLLAGTNMFTVTITDVVGNTTLTNISVVQSPLTLTINPVVPASQLWQSNVNLTGTISDPAYAVWVNGIKGHNAGDGTWSATNVPINNGGTASFVATAYAPNEQQPDGSYGN